jgi:2-keto-3-deoxy-L-rhamnonate aldolase RhmA
MSTRPRHPAHQCRAAFKKAVREGKPLFGLFLGSSSPLVAEQLAYLQYDYMLVSNPASAARSCQGSYVLW